MRFIGIVFSGKSIRHAGKIVKQSVTCCPLLFLGTSILMAKTKVGIFTDKSWSSQTRWSKDKIKYDVTTTTCCPKCGEDVDVGTVGPAGLSQHTGKSKCKKNVEGKKKQEKEGKMWTLFNVGVKKVNVVPQEPAMLEASSSMRKYLASPLPIIIYPLQGSASNNTLWPKGMQEHQGCLLGQVRKIGIVRVMHAQKSGVIRIFLHSLMYVNKM